MRIEGTSRSQKGDIAINVLISSNLGRITIAPVPASSVARQADPEMAPAPYAI